MSGRTQVVGHSFLALRKPHLFAPDLDSHFYLPQLGFRIHLARHIACLTALTHLAEFGLNSGASG
jgi:hypothetical protein